MFVRDRCLLGFALPLTQEDFFNDLDPRSDKDYAKSRKRKLRFNNIALWETDHMPVIKLFNDLKNELQAFDITIKTEFKLADFSMITGYDVVTIVSHYMDKKGQVELYDGLFSVDNIISTIPSGYQGLFDLTICDSTILQDALNRHAKKTLVVANRDATHLDLRLILYKNIIKYMNAKNVNYGEAAVKVRMMLLE